MSKSLNFEIKSKTKVLSKMIISWLKIVCDLLSLALLGLSIIILIIWGKSVDSGFNCNDQSINRPFKENTVTTLHLVIISIILPLGLILCTELVKGVLVHANKEQKVSCKINLCCSKTRNVNKSLNNIYFYIGKSIASI